MNFLLLNILLALVWSALNGQFSPEYLVSGFTIGYLMLVIARRALNATGYVSRVPRIVRFILYFIVELFRANIRVAWEVLTPGFHMSPAIVSIPLTLTDPIQITLLSQMITLTPGTLSLDVSTDRRVLYVHAMYVNDVEDFRRSIKNGFEKQIQAVFE